MIPDLEPLLADVARVLSRPDEMTEQEAAGLHAAMELYPCPPEFDAATCPHGCVSGHCTGCPGAPL